MTGLVVRESPGRGRGVFAARHFAVGEMIEVCPVIALSAGDAAKLDDTHLYNYYFGWGDDGKGAAIALGFGSLYNHSPTPNAAYRKDMADGTITIIALRGIVSGEEISVRYNFGAGGEPDALWFAVR